MGGLLKFQALVDLVQHSIASGVLKPGDRLPSIRDMGAKMGVSTVTVQHAYSLLETEGVLEARARSGFFVLASLRPLSEFSAGPMRFGDANDTGQAEAGPLAAGGFAAFEAACRDGQLRGFGSPHVSPDLLPSAELHRCLLNSLKPSRPLPGAPPEGALALREAIARRLMSRGLTINAGQILLARGLRSALGACLDLAARAGHAVIVESPADTDSIAAILHRGLRVIEIYSHPRFGIDPDQFRHLLENNAVAACVLTASNHKPTGISYAADTLASIVQEAARRGAVIIENDTASELGYSAIRAPTYKQFDTGDHVLQAGGFADTLGPGFGLGWVVLNRRFQAPGLRRRPGREPLMAEVATQLAIAEFMGRRSYDRHVRRLRQSLGARMRRGLVLVAQRFPSSCAVSHPAGGFTCWVRGPKGFDALSAAKRAARQGAGFAPGPMFSITRWFANFMALNFSHPWDQAAEDQIDTVARLLR